jgi:beta-xylosidase
MCIRDRFRIGVASSDKPEGPFLPNKEPIKGTYSIDPCVFESEDGNFYMYFGGIWGGQLQRWNGNNEYDPKASNKTKEEPAVLPRMARLNADMTSLAEPVKEIQLLNVDGKPFGEKDNDKRFFEAPWVFKKDNTYYFTYSTGDTHNLCYATGSNPYGPFTYKGVFMDPVDGWTSHHSILKLGEKWILFYHDVQLSGKTHLRNIKATEITFNTDGSINKLSSKK